MHPDPEAIRQLGSPGMVGPGPGEDLRRKHFDAMQQDVKKVSDYLHHHPHDLSERDIKNFLDHLKALEKEVSTYCKRSPGANVVLTSYYNVLNGLNVVKEAFGKKDLKKLAATLTREVPKVAQNLQVIVQHHYVAAAKA
jgi:hypothetical protein